MPKLCKVIRFEHILYGCGPYRIRSQVLHSYLDRSNPNYRKKSGAEYKIINDNIQSVNDIIGKFVALTEKSGDGVYGYTKHPTPSISFGKHIEDILADKFDGLPEDKTFNEHIVFGFQSIQAFDKWFFDQRTIDLLCEQGFEIVEYSVPTDSVVKDIRGDQLIFDKRKIVSKRVLKTHYEK